MKKSSSAASLLTVNAYWGGLSYMWSALHPILLPAMLAALVPPERKNTYLGLLTFTGLVIAMVLQPLSGAISDRWVSRFGRRRPLMLIGTAFSVLFLSILGWAGGLVWIFIGYVGLQISANTAQGPLQGLLRDRVAQNQLGVASSIKVFLDLGSLVAASLISGQLTLEGAGPQAPAFLVIIGLLIASAGVTILFTTEEASEILPLENEAVREGLDGTGVPPRPGYRWLILERGTFLLGIYGLQAFGQYYIQDALHVADAPRASGNLLSVIGAATILFVLAAGWFADHAGPMPLLYVASALAAVGMLGMLGATELTQLYGAGSLIGAGMGLFLTANWTLANHMAPVADAGRHLGLANVATAGAAALARLEGPAVDWLNAAQPDAWRGYQAVFIFGATCFLLSTWFLTKLRKLAAQ